MPAVLRGEVWRGELSLRSPEGARAIPISNVLLAQRAPGGEIDFVASIARDTSAQKALEARLQHQADHDELTSLPNRTPLITWLDEAIRHVDRFGSSVAVLFSDIDRFKVMNDSLGHQAGDQLLVAMSRRLLGCARDPTTASRASVGTSSSSSAPVSTVRPRRPSSRTVSAARSVVGSRSATRRSS